MTQSEGTAFAQKDKKGKPKKSATTTNPKKVEFDKEFYKDKECFRCGKKGHPKSACTVKMVAADDDKSTKSSSSKMSSITGASGDVGKMMTSINKTFKTMWKAMSQISEEIGNFGDEDSIGAQSHALVCSTGCYAFANGTAVMRN